ncbi:hypothetical protein FIBSPDRAFT_534496 [Athelia psychrophila]|uniref:Uncharacterized protein n=1 Tax=Athelia psychrophila TaxID=1759441 RepID=A0A167THL0_9AGAM|nr:hypothetical protein FIBSPDRAFT_534496 [Fibularhizoctonia sp. CBS 109695]
MPSVRIKKADYAQLEAGDSPVQPSTFPRALANAFSNGSDSPTQTTRTRRATVSSAEQPTVPGANIQLVRRPRAGSRVADHVLNKPLSSNRLQNQRSNSPLIGGSPRRSTSRRSVSSRRSNVLGMAVMEGPQADVSVESAIKRQSSGHLCV